MAEFLDYILSQEYLPSVISSSYGDDEQTVPEAYARRVCQSFAQLGARGVSFLVSSGDNGVGAPRNCVANTGNNASTFLSIFPASCPYVTSVGATKGFNPEVAAANPSNAFWSGGGFSNYFPRPTYQDTAVQTYLEGLNGVFDGLYNQSGRGYPDVSAQVSSFAKASPHSILTTLPGPRIWHCLERGGNRSRRNECFLSHRGFDLGPCQ